MDMNLRPIKFQLPEINLNRQMQLPLKTSPKQQTFNFDEVMITSEFDSGNLIAANKVNSNTYSLQIGSDCEGILLDHQIPSYKVWFNFGVKSSHSQSLKFTILNLNNFFKLLKSGYKIVYKELEPGQSPSEFQKQYQENEEYTFKRLNQEMNIKYVEETNLVELTFEYNFKPNCFVLFSFCFPWSYEKNLAFLNYLSHKLKSNNEEFRDIYFHNEVLTLSKGKKNVNLLTITSRNNIIKGVSESKLAGLFPFKERCFQASHDKSIIFISARVHPGETPSAYMMNGILKFLTDKNPHSDLLRENFVFKIIPIINVDGVSSGNFRLDNTGQNLNRCYLNPEMKNDPENYAIKKLFMFYTSKYKVRYYFDLHADMNCKGVYTFGNAINEFISHVENVLFSFVFKINCSNVNWDKCTFKETCMKSKSKFDKNSKEASSRVHFYKATGLIHTYTVESSYYTGNFHNEEDTSLYTPKSFEKTGRDLLLTILDYEELTTSDFLLNSEYKTLKQCRSYVAEFVQKTEDRFKLSFQFKTLAKEINNEKKWLSIQEQTEKIKRIWTRANTGKFLLPGIRQRTARGKSLGKKKVEKFQIESKTNTNLNINYKTNSTNNVEEKKNDYIQGKSRSKGKLPFERIERFRGSPPSNVL